MVTLKLEDVEHLDAALYVYRNGADPDPGAAVFEPNNCPCPRAPLGDELLLAAFVASICSWANQRGLLRVTKMLVAAQPDHVGNDDAVSLPVRPPGRSM